MAKNLINGKVTLKLSDPWDLGEQLGWKEIDAVILNVKDEEGILTSVAIKLVNPFNYKNTHCEYFIATPRYEGNNFNQLQNNQTVICGLTRIPSDQINTKDPFDLSHWRGGVGLIGNIEFK